MAEVDVPGGGGGGKGGDDTDKVKPLGADIVCSQMEQKYFYEDEVWRMKKVITIYLCFKAIYLKTQGFLRQKS